MDNRAIIGQMDPHVGEKNRLYMYSVRILFWLLLIIAVGYISGYIFTGRSSTIAPASLALCFNDKVLNAETGRCIKEHVDALLSATSTASLMEYLTSSEASPAVQNNCHAIGHIVGSETYKKYGDITQALAHCVSNCRSACTHGVIGAAVQQQLGEEYPDDDIAHASTAELKALGTRYCAINQSACHGMGHVAYIAAKTDLDALHICDAIASSGKLREACYEGVFMERAGNFYNVLSPENGEKSPEIRSGDYAYPCQSLPSKYQYGCFLFLPYYQVPLFSADGLAGSSVRLQKSISVCQSLSPVDRSSCITGIGATSFLYGTVGVKVSELGPFCESFISVEDKDSCIRGASLQYLYFDEAEGFAYCENMSQEQQKKECYDLAFELREDTHNFRNDRARMCGKSASCLIRYDQYVGSVK